jgi:hypothetical protein
MSGRKPVGHTPKIYTSSNKGLYVTPSNKQTIQSIRKIPQFESDKTIFLDSSDVYQYLQQFYKKKEDMSLPEKFIIESVGQAPSAWEYKKDWIIETMINPLYDKMQADVKSNEEFVHSLEGYDSDESVYNNMNDQFYEHYSKSNYSRILRSLKHHYIFDLGFKIVNSWSSDNKYCQCPCSSFNADWRKKHNLVQLRGLDAKCSTIKTKYYTPLLLMNHLREYSGADGFVHAAILEYLQNLYIECVPINERINLDHYAVVEKCHKVKTKQQVLNNFTILPIECDMTEVEQYHSLHTDSITVSKNIESSSLGSVGIESIKDSSLFVLDKEIVESKNDDSIKHVTNTDNNSTLKEVTTSYVKDQVSSTNKKKPFSNCDGEKVTESSSTTNLATLKSSSRRTESLKSSVEHDVLNKHNHVEGTIKSSTLLPSLGRGLPHSGRGLPGDGGGVSDYGKSLPNYGRGGSGYDRGSSGYGTGNSSFRRSYKTNDRGRKNSYKNFNKNRGRKSYVDKQMEQYYNNRPIREERIRIKSRDDDELKPRDPLFTDTDRKMTVSEKKLLDDQAYLPYYYNDDHIHQRGNKMYSHNPHTPFHYDHRGHQPQTHARRGSNDSFERFKQNQHKDNKNYNQLPTHSINKMNDLWSLLCYY